ncbi:MAG: 30S ribosomal protein S6 [Phycisphaerales bacterium]
MRENRTYTYEIMFLVGQAQAADFSGTIEHIRDLLGRAHAEILAMKKWDERRLAYEIKKQKRGLYILAYVNAPANSMRNFERDCNLSEKILRVLILRADHYTPEELVAHDAREALETEAKLRAKQAAERPADTATATVTTAAPVAAPAAVAEAEPE